MLIPRYIRLDTAMDAGNRRWNAMRLCFLEYNSPTGPFDMPFLRHDHELDYFCNLRQLMAQVSDFRRMSYLEMIWFKRLYDRLYLAYNASNWWQELNLEGCHERGTQNLRFLGCHNQVVFALQHSNQHGLYA